MKTRFRRVRMRGATLCCALLATLCITLLCPVECAFSEGTPTIVLVEEDWELVVATPDSNSTAPQVTCAVFPFPGSPLYATLELNHQSQPEFVPGGVQLQVWEDEVPMVTRKFPNNGVMSAVGETVRWTQKMSLNEGTLTYEVVDGSSQTWGAFGGQGYLRAAVNTELSHLNGYSPSATVADSGVGYAGNRVQRLVLKAVRLVSSEGEVFEDLTDRQVYPKN